jgi:integrase
MWTPETARTEAKRLLGLVASKVDPASERIRPAETFGAELDRYLERKQSALKPRSMVEIERHLRVQCKSLHNLRLGEIDRRTIALTLADIEAESGPVTRNRARASLSAFFTWAIKEGLAEVNVVSGTAQANEGPSRERTLTQAELVQVLRALSADPGPFSDIVRLLILTGQRRDEIGGLKWSEIDLERNLIVFGAERIKNKRQHELPMSAQVRAILADYPRSGGEFVWGRRWSSWSRSKANLDGKLDGMAEWRLHDLRRTAATQMAELGVLPHIIGAVLNHVSGHRAGVAGIYNRARYADEMRLVLQRWADHIDGLMPNAT